MLFSFLIASVSAGPTNTAGIDPNLSPMPINITNRCGVDGAVDHEFMVTLKPPTNSNGRRLETTEDKLSFLQGWVHQYDPEDTSNGTSNDATRRKLEANSNSTHIVHLFTETQFAVAISADDDVRLAQHAATCMHMHMHMHMCMHMHILVHVMCMSTCICACACHVHVHAHV